MNRNNLIAALVGVGLAVVCIVVMATVLRPREPMPVVPQGGENQEVNEENGTDEGSVPVAESCTPVDAVVTTKSSEDTFTQTILVDGKSIMAIDTHAMFGWPEAESSLYKQTDCYAYVEMSATGRGGYIFYGGPDKLYRIDLHTKQAEMIGFNGFLLDISPDETLVASMAMVDGKEGTTNAVEFTNIDSGSIVRGPAGASVIPAPYNDAGAGKFSPDGKWFAYGAIERDWDGGGDPVKAAVITVVVATGEQTVAVANVPAGYGAYVTGWDASGKPIVEKQP